MLERILRIEPLEDRRMLAVVTVDTHLDVVDSFDEFTSLREAIAQTNGISGPDTIEFNASLTGRTILLTQGELLIEDDLTVTGLGSDQLTIDASGSDPTPDENNGDGSRIFHMPLNTDGTENSLSVSGLTLTGGDPESSLLTFGGGGAVSAFGSLSAADLIVTENHAYSGGGGIHASTVDGKITIVNSLFLNNVVSETDVVSLAANPAARGGGAYIRVSNGIVDITGSDFRENEASFGGGLSVAAFGEDAVVSVSSVELEHNVARPEFRAIGLVYYLNKYGGGGLSAELRDGASFYLRSSSVRDNSTIGSQANLGLNNGRPFVGGGVHIAAFNNSLIELSATRIDGNRVNGHGGGLYAEIGQQIELNVNDSEFISNVSELGPGGGAYFEFAESGSVVNINDTTLQKNQAKSGGAISYWAEDEIAGSQLNLFGVSVTDNRVEFSGGGVGQSRPPVPGTFILTFSPYVGVPVSLTISRSLVASNRSERAAGGIFAATPPEQESPYVTTIVDSTISGNEAGSEGGGIHTESGRTYFYRGTVAQNISNSDEGAGVSTSTSTNSPFIFDTSGDAESILKGTIVAGNHGVDVYRNENPFGLPSFVSFGHNLIGSTSGTWTHDPRDILGVTNPLLGPLADNGGPTLTHALLPDSPALDAGDPNAVADAGGVPLTDQRQDPYSRIVGGRIDIGAYERQSQHADFDSDGDVDGRDFLTWQRGYGTANALGNQGDSNGDSQVDADDLLAWQNSHGATPLSSQLEPTDFDRNLQINGADFLAWQRGFGSLNATRVDGDADGDSDVDHDDLAAWQDAFSLDVPVEVPLAIADLVMPFELAAVELAGMAEVDLIRPAFTPSQRTAVFPNLSALLEGSKLQQSSTTKAPSGLLSTPAEETYSPVRNALLAEQVFADWDDDFFSSPPSAHLARVRRR